MTLADILLSETKGKWWLVGAAWSGDPLVDHTEKVSKPTPENMENEKLLKLARDQGMNTDIRRSIFIVLMTSEVCSTSMYPARHLINGTGLSRRF